VTVSSRSVTKLERLVAVLVAALVAAVASLALASPAAAGNAEDEARLFELTNQARGQNGLGALAYDPAAVSVARSWAAELARSGQLRHNPNLVANVNAFVTTEWTRVGENVGYAGSADQVQTAYMNSPGHRANILGDYNRVGIGAVRDGSGRLWTTVVFVKGPALSVAPPAPVVPNTAFAPFPSAQAFVSQQFLDVLGRPADPAGLATWTAALQSGATSQAGMVAALMNSPEANVVIEPVNRLYRAYFKRNPDVAGLNYWMGRLRSGATLGQVSAAFASSPEFVGTYGALNDQGFVDLVYRNVLGRPADAAGAGYWVMQLGARRLDRGGVMVNFSESAEYRAATGKWNDVVQVYVGLLRRSPDQGTLDTWIGQLNAGKPLTDLIASVLGSNEYKSRRF
jgi:uncharacterized protein YkwD